MPYLEACVLETLRLISHVPLAVPHATVCDTIVCGKKIPKNTTVSALLRISEKLFERKNFTWCNAANIARICTTEYHINLISLVGRSKRLNFGTVWLNSLIDFPRDLTSVQFDKDCELKLFALILLSTVKVVKNTVSIKKIYMHFFPTGLNVTLRLFKCQLSVNSQKCR